MIYRVVHEVLDDVKRAGKVPIAIYMNSANYKILIKWIERMYTTRSDKTSKYQTPTYLGIPLIVDESVPTEEAWLKYVWPSMLEREVMKIEDELR